MKQLRKWLCRMKVLLLQQFRTPVFYVILVLLSSLQIYLCSISLPAASNRVIGLVNAGGHYAEAVTNALLNEESSYVWKLYPDREALQDAVTSGSADSGFVFDERLDAAAAKAEATDYENATGIATPDLSGLVDYYVSSSSTKGAAAKESVYACLFSQMAPVVLKCAIRSGALFANPGEEVCQTALEEMQKVIEEDMLLHVRFETRGKEEDSSSSGEENPSASPAMIASILMFAAALLFAAAKFREGSAALYIWLRRGGWIFRALEVFAPLLPVGIALTVLLIVQGLPAKPGLLLIIPVLLLTSVWTSLFARLFRRESVYLFMSVALLLVAGILTSSAGELFFLNSVRWLRVVFPSYWIKECLLL